MCTSLIYRDSAGRAYFGRTLELTVELPYQVAYVPKGTPFSSHVEGYPALDYTAVHAFIGVTIPGRIPTAEAPIGFGDLKPLEGLNDQGLTFSLLSYPSAGGRQEAVATTRAMLSASDLGSWALARFATVAEVKAALDAQPVMLEALAMLGGAVSPFHYVVHDATGAALVIEFDNGTMRLYDNPVGVMTNGPSFAWHLTNLDNYTFLSNVDRSQATFGNYQARQPDSGIATAGLPASNTSVGRFVRAAYYAQFTEPAATPERAIAALAHIMNNFDRPRGASIDYPQDGGGHMEVEGLAEAAGTAYATEFTSWTNLADLTGGRFFIRSYDSLGYTAFDLSALANLSAPKVLPLARLAGAEGTDGTAQLRNA